VTKANVVKLKTLRDRVSDAEWQVRVDLAACYRLAHHFGMTDLVYTHISARVPGPDEHFLINPYGLLFNEISASSLIKVDLDGAVVLKPDLDYPVNQAGFVIHSARRRRLRHAYPHPRRHGAVGARLRAVAADPDRDAVLRPDRLSRL
jgi:Class II Aldolase and Adducin N-terminal domain